MADMIHLLRRLYGIGVRRGAYKGRESIWKKKGEKKEKRRNKLAAKTTISPTEMDDWNRWAFVWRSAILPVADSRWWSDGGMPADGNPHARQLMSVDGVRCPAEQRRSNGGGQRFGIERPSAIRTRGRNGWVRGIQINVRRSYRHKVLGVGRPNFL